MFILYYIYVLNFYATTLAKLSANKQLIRAYPELDSTIIQFINEPNLSYKGEYVDRVPQADGWMARTISINTAKLDEAIKQYGLDKERGGLDTQRRIAAHSILIHELQHTVQQYFVLLYQIPK